MPSSSVVVIGAGLAGLACGTYARRNGWEVTVVERQQHTGGVAACWERDGYLVDGGIHFLMGHQPGSALRGIYDELGCAAPGTVVNAPVYAGLIDETTGRQATVGRDLRSLPDQLSTNPSDRAALKQLVSGALTMTRTDLTASMIGAPEFATRFDKLAEAWRMRRSWRSFGAAGRRTAAELADEMSDPFAAWAVRNLFLPESPLWFLQMLLALVGSDQLGLLATGSRGFVAPLEESLVSAGGELRLGAEVNRVVLEGGRVSGVRLASGETIPAGIIVATGDVADLNDRLLGGEPIDPLVAQRRATWPLTRPIVMLSFGVESTFPDTPWLTMLRVADPISVGPDRVDSLAVRTFNYSDAFAPKGHTVVQVMFETDWMYWKTLYDTDLRGYREAKRALAVEVLRRVDPHFPALAAHTRMADIATPVTTWRYTLNRQGAYMGWFAPAAELMRPIPRAYAGVRGLYGAGQWWTPGGSVPSSILSGRQLVQVLCAEGGRTFTPA
jgi:phytoene dehydrogenase-like protein